jgi:hypothetical protein
LNALAIDRFRTITFTMYRVLAPGRFGVGGGPYTGAPRTLSAMQLSAEVRTRLANVLAKRGLPAVVAERQQNLDRGFLAAGLFCLLTIVSVVLLLRNASLPLQMTFHSQGALLVYGFVGVLFGWALAYLLVHLRLAVPRGVFLLPLDLVTISKTQVHIRAMGELQRAEVSEARTPQNKGRDAYILRLTFRDGQQEHFAFDAAIDAEEAYRALEEAQVRLEELTHSPNLEDMVALDPFFSMRGTPIWQAAQSPDEAPELRKRDTRQRRTAFALAAVLGAGASSGVRATRNDLADDALFKRESALAYLEKTHVHGHDRAAKAELRRLESVRASDTHHQQHVADFERTASREKLSTTASRDLEPWVREEEQKLIAEGNAKYAQVASKDPRIRALMEKAPTRGSETGRRTIRIMSIVLPYLSLKDVHGCVPTKQVSAMWKQINASLDTVLAKLYSPEVLRFDFGDTGSDADLVVTTTTEDGGMLDHSKAFDAVRVLFSVDLQGAKDPKLLRLALAPKKVIVLRSSSLFSQMDPACRDGYFPALARSFDQLYDELYELFFSGPIQIPANLVAPK